MVKLQPKKFNKNGEIKPKNKRTLLIPLTTSQKNKNCCF